MRKVLWDITPWSVVFILTIVLPFIFDSKISYEFPFVLIMVGIPYVFAAFVYFVKSIYMSATKSEKQANILWGGVFLFLAAIWCWIAIGQYPERIAFKRFYDIQMTKLESEVAKDTKESHKSPVEKAAVRELFEKTRSEFLNKEVKPGEYGDQFGMVNSLFAGLALVGVVLAVVMQSHERKIQDERHSESVDLQRLELIEARSANINMYHLQAIQTYMSVEEKEWYKTEDTIQQGMIDDLLSSIKYLREQGDIEEGFMKSLRSRVAERLEDLHFDASNYWSGGIYNPEAIDKLVMDIDHINKLTIGNGILPDLSKKIIRLSTQYKSELNGFEEIEREIGNIIFNYRSGES